MNYLHEQFNLEIYPLVSQSFGGQIEYWLVI